MYDDVIEVVARFSIYKYFVLKYRFKILYSIIHKCCKCYYLILCDLRICADVVDVVVIMGFSFPLLLSLSVLATAVIR